MRFIFGSIAALLMGILWMGCTTVSPDECWLTTSGGFGGSGTLPIGAGVGATSGGDPLEPPRGPLDNKGDAPNPCIMPSNPCDQKCLDAYEVAALTCGKIIKDDAQYKMCAEGAYAAYKSCHGNCQEDPEAQESQCRKRCAEQAEVCDAGCRKIPEDDKNARRRLAPNAPAAVRAVGVDFPRDGQHRPCV